MLAGMSGWDAETDHTNGQPVQYMEENVVLPGNQGKDYDVTMISSAYKLCAESCTPSAEITHWVTMGWNDWQPQV